MHMTLFDWVIAVVVIVGLIAAYGIITDATGPKSKK